MAAVCGCIRTCSKRFQEHHVTLSLLISTVLFAGVCSIPFVPDNPLVSRAAAVAVFMASMWVLTPIPVAVTGLAPLVLFPLLGVMNGRDVARQYFSDTHFIFIGSFFLADGLQRVNLHKRISIKLLMVLGVKPFWLLFGFCVSTFLLSTCLSNTATTIMLMPLTVSVVDWMEAQANKQDASSGIDVVGSNFGAGEEADQGEDDGDQTGVEGNHKAMLLEGSWREQRRRRRSRNNTAGGDDVEMGMLDADDDQADHHLRLGACQSSPELPDEEETAASQFTRMRKALALGVAYSANIGGVVTLTGTLPNLVYQGQLPLLFESAPPVTFAQWFSFAAPFGCAMFVIAFLMLSFLFCPPTCGRSSSRRQDSLEHCSVLIRENEALGKLRFAEIVVMTHGAVLVLLWFTRTSIGGGWSSLVPEPAFVTDGTAAILVSLSMFLWPAEPPTWWRRLLRQRSSTTNTNDDEEGDDRGGESAAAQRPEDESGGASGRLLDASAVFKLPWDCVLLLGGGFALAEGSKVSGLAAFLASCLGSLSAIRPLLLLFVTVLITSLVTEFNSNLAATSMLLPVVAQLSVALRVHPLAHMIPTTIACSFAFMLPVATPPNAIAFATNAITTRDMISSGVGLNLMACLLVTLYTAWAFPLVYGEDPFVCPEWACPNA